MNIINKLPPMEKNTNPEESLEPKIVNLAMNSYDISKIDKGKIYKINY